MFDDDGENFILFENIDIGVSVTNASEQLAEEIVNQYQLQPGDCRFFETYREYDYKTVDEIEYTWVKEKFRESSKWSACDARWKPANEFKSIF